MKQIFVFPGQGSQTIGMGKLLAEIDTTARHVFEEVDDALSLPLSKIMWQGSLEELTLTQNAQPALMAVSMAVVRTLEASGYKLADKGHYLAGHSLGEYSALTAAGVFSLADCARLLRIRGEAMQKAVPVGQGAMAAIIGLEFAEVAALALEVSAADSLCRAANDNGGGQTVISGHKTAVDRVLEIAKERGAKRALLLPVSAPFHSPLMQPAAERMAEALMGVAFAKPALPIITNVSAAPENAPERLRTLLVEQVTGVVRWRETIENLKALGVDQLVELGAGKVLSGLAKRIDGDLSLFSLEKPEQIDQFLKDN